MFDEKSQEHRTALRFPVQVPVNVRVGDSEMVCSTRDISHRGVFVVTDQPLPEHSPIEFTMKLRSPDSPQDGLQVVCCGTVVRVESPNGEEVGMAATIDSYRFLQSPKGNA